MWNIRKHFILIILTAVALTAVSCDGVTVNFEDGSSIGIDGEGNIVADESTGIIADGGLQDTSQLGEDTAVSGDWYELYFTNPTCPDEEDRVGGIDEFIAEDLLNAQAQVDVAAFDLDSEPIVNALIELEERGIIVRVVTDEDNGELSSINRLRRNGISVIEDKRSAIMHNKFIVIDGRYVWTGSMNFTSNGIFCNNNNMARIDSPQLANNFLVEMSEMYDEQEFGPRSPVNTPNEKLTIGGVQVENYFAPEIELVPIIGDLINQANDEILFMAFSFTSDGVGEPMFERAEAGVDVRGVFETTGSQTEYSYYGEMNEAGLPNMDVRQDGNGRIMHHKVIILDRETVIFGSFNFSNNANDSNDEAIVVVHDPTFAQYFVDEFEAVWGEAKTE